MKTTSMTLEEYNQLGSDFAHCSGVNCERAGECLCHKIPQDARKEHAEELCRDKSDRDNGRAALSAL